MKIQKDFYIYLITKECENILKANCIPGNNLLNNRKITGYYLVENHLNSKPDNEGAYVCSCGSYYKIEPCGFPRKGVTSKCSYCGEKIGYAPLPTGIKGQHGFVRREGHYRIFKNDKVRNEQFKLYQDSSENDILFLFSDFKVDNNSSLLIVPLLFLSKLRKASNSLSFLK